MKQPKSFWIVLDPLDGPHLFASRKECENNLNRWKKDANGYPHDSYWDMTGPLEYRKVPRAIRRGGARVNNPTI